jgi:hypothetical protein
MNPDMSEALSMDAAAPAPMEGDMFASDPAAEPAADALALGEADETELDSIFAADAADLFPEFDDTQLSKLQKLIDSRLGAATA